MSAQTIAQVGIGLKSLTWPVCIIAPLFVSSMQAGRFLQSMGHGNDGFVMLALGCCIIFSSPIIGLLTGYAFRNDQGFAAFMGLVVWVVIVLFSASTSSLSILNTTGTAIQGQINTSPKIVALESALKANQDAIVAKQAQIDGRDAVRWASKRDSWAKDIQSLHSDNRRIIEQVERARDAGDGSPVAQAFSRLAVVGITPTRIALLASILLDLIPFVAGLLMGANATTQRAKDDNGASKSKKPQAPNLKAVAGGRA